MIHNQRISSLYIFSDYSYFFHCVSIHVSIFSSNDHVIPCRKLFKNLIRVLCFHSSQISHQKLIFVYMTDTFFNWILFHFPCFFCRSPFQLAFFFSSDLTSSLCHFLKLPVEKMVILLCSSIQSQWHYIKCSIAVAAWTFSLSELTCLQSSWYSWEPFEPEPWIVMQKLYTRYWLY